VNAIIAFAISMTTTLTGWFIGFLTGYLPWVSVISIIIVTGLMLIAIFSEDFRKLIKQNKKKVLRYGAVFVIATLGIVLVVLGEPIFALMDPEPLLSALGLSTADIWGLIFFIAFIVTLYVIGKGSGDKPPKSSEE
jgi:polyferredoxin